MIERRADGPTSLHRHRRAPGRGACLYETALRQAIATRHGLRDGEHAELRACAGCGAAYLLVDVWQPFAEDGEIGCPRCGAPAVAWHGPRGYLAYWWDERGRARETRRGAATRPPLA